MPSSGFEPALETAIECSARAPAQARRAIEKLAGALDPDTLRDAQLVVSELVTNSVRHSGSDEPIRLRAWARATGAKFEIADGGFGFEPGEREIADGEGGRGLLILNSLAARWGVSRDVRTRVWFEMRRRPASGERAQTG